MSPSKSSSSALLGTKDVARDERGVGVESGAMFKTCSILADDGSLELDGERGERWCAIAREAR